MNNSAAPQNEPTAIWSAIHQFVPTLLQGDAIGDHVIRIRDQQRARGRYSEIFVDVERDDTSHLTHPVTHLDRHVSAQSAHPDTLLMYHVAQASACAEFLLTRPEPLALQFHNFTPVDLLVGWDASAACDMLEAGRQLDELAAAAAIGISDSAFNAAELTERGVACSMVASIPVEAVAKLSPDLEKAGRPTVLFVGRVAPNKAFHDLVATAAVLRHRVADVEVRLVGGETSESYSQALRQLVRALELDDTVTFTGRVTDEELQREYGRAHVFCSLSDHEGFGVPLLEAMAHGLPIVAFDSTAVGETVGGAGLVLGDKAPTIVAAAIERVLADNTLSAQLRDWGRARALEFTAQRSDHQFELAFIEAWRLTHEAANS